MRNSLLRALTFLVIASAASAANARAQSRDTATMLPSVTLPAALDRVLRDYERAWRDRDPATLAALFAEDGFVLSNGNTPARGPAAIRERYATSGGPLSLRALAFAVDDTVGYIIGAFAAQPGQNDAGKFVLALRRRPGQPWLIAADIDNSNRR